MPALGAFTIDAATSQTAETSLPFVVGSTIAPSFVVRDTGAYDVLWYPPKRALVYANGRDFQHHVIDALCYLNGPRAPKNAPTLVSTGTRATAVLTVNATPADGETVTVGFASGAVGSYTFTFKTALTRGVVNEVLIGGSASAAIANAEQFINGSNSSSPGVNGTDFWLGSLYGTDSYAHWSGVHKIEVSATSASTITFRAIAAGTEGNSYVSTETLGAAGSQFAGGSAVFTGGAVGTGFAPAAGTYEGAYAFLRHEDDAQTAIGASTEVINEQAWNLTFSAYDTPATRDEIDFFRIFRTTVDGSQFFRIGEDASSPFTDSVDDEDINDSDFSEYDPSIYRPYHSGYPDRYVCHAIYKGCLFGAGAEIAAQYSAGTADCDPTGAATVVLSAAARPKTDWINRTFAVDGDAVTDYRIVEVDESTRTLTLNKAYEGAAAGTASYTVTDDRDPFELYYTPPLLFNNWPPENSVKGITGRDPAGVVALRAAWQALLAWTKTSVWRIHGDPESGFDFNHDHDGCGAYNQSSVVEADGEVFWLGPDGIFRMAEGGAPVSVSKPAFSEGAARGIEGTLARITDSAVRGVVGNYNPTEDVIRWWVPMDGVPYNTHAIVYSLQSGAFTLDETSIVTDAKTITGSDGASYTLTGDAHGTVWQNDIGNVDGGFGFEPVQAISTYTASTRSVVLSGTPALPTTSGGLRGVPVYHKSATGLIQRQIIASNTADTIVLVAPFDTAPATADQVVIGDIRHRALSSKSDFGTPESKKMLSSVTVAAIPTTNGQMWVAGASDDSDPTLQTRRSGSDDDYDLTSTDGQKTFLVRRGPGFRVQVEINAFGSGVDMAITNVTVVTRERSPDMETVQ